MSAELGIIPWRRVVKEEQFSSDTYVSLMHGDALDLSALGGELEQDFTESRDVPGIGEVWLPPVPTDLGLLILDTIDEDFKDNAEAFRHFERNGLLQTLISFTWEEDGTDPFESSLEIVTVNERSYLTISPDATSDQEWEAFVAIDDATPESWEALLIDLSRDNGVAYGMEIFSSLPTRVDTVAIAPRYILSSFYSYLQWDEERSPGAWQTSAEYLPGVLQSNVSLTNAAAKLLEDDSKQNRFTYVSTYVAAVYHDPSQELSVVAAS